MDRLQLDLQRLHQARQAGRLAGRELEYQPAEGGGVHHRVLEGSRQPAAEDPGVERVVAVLDQHRSSGEMEEAAPGVAELRRVDQHLALDQVPSLGVGVDRRPGMDEGVEKAQRPAQPEALGPDLEDQEGPVAGRLDVDGDELRLLQRGVGPDRGEFVLANLQLPEHQLAGASRLQLERPSGSVVHGVHRKIKGPDGPPQTDLERHATDRQVPPRHLLPSGTAILSRATTMGVCWNSPPMAAPIG